MKTKTMILSAALLTVIASISCSSFPVAPTPTEMWEPYLSTPAGPLGFEPEALPAAQEGVMYEAEIHITQNVTPAGDISITQGSLPAGLEFVKVEGEDTAKISGIPQEAGRFAFTVSVWCYGTMVSGQSGEHEYEIVVEGAQSSGLPVTYENISFHIPLALNASVNAFTDTQWEFPSINPSNGPMPAHAIFEFTNYPVESSYPAHEGARIMVFKSSEYAAHGSTEQDAVTALLAGQESAQPIPDALVMGMFYAQGKTVSFQNGHGVRYLTQVLDGVAPISNDRIFYYYQGVTNDGAYFVSAIFHVNAAFLVATSDKEASTPADGVIFTWDQEVDFTKYLDEITRKLNDTPDESFTPSLAVFDQLIGSMEIVSP